MTLRVDRAFSGSLCSKETEDVSVQWRTRIPEFTCVGTATGVSPAQNSKDADVGRPKDMEKSCRKSVTMAPTSRYLTDRRQYVMRKPLFATEQQTSILKKSNTQEHAEMDTGWRGRSREACHQRIDVDFHTRGHEEMTPIHLDFSQANASSYLTSREDLTSSALGMSDLKGRLSHEEPTICSPHVSTGSSRSSLSSPPLEGHRLTSHIRPRLSSTLLSPTYALSPRHPRCRVTEFRLGRKGEEERQTHLRPSLSNFKGHVSPVLHTMSPHQANYWACAIPRSLPPSPDRHSPGWDPDREYQALLDYTYPLRPGRVVSEWDSSGLRGGSPIQTDTGLQDSGIELDHLCSSTNLSGLDLSLSASKRRGAGQPSWKGTVGIGHRSAEQRELSKSSDALLSDSPIYLTDPIGLSLESLDSSNNRSRTQPTSHSKGVGHDQQHGAFNPSPSSSSSATFIRSTSILPRPGCVGGGREYDEEFRPLPDQLEELQYLSRQVREVTAQLSQQVTGSWESLEQGTASVNSSINQADKQEAEEEAQKEVGAHGQYNEDSVEGTHEGRTWHSATPAFPNKVHHGGVSSLAAGHPGPRMEPVGRGVSRASLRDAEVLVEQLSGLSFAGYQRKGQDDQGHSESLMHHIQVFCSDLEQLIQWLYTVVERMEMLSPPIVDIDSVKSSLAEYQNFQREVSTHQPLTSAVLQTGERLLSCMNSTSPVLRDTLVLIEKQSNVLESHIEHLFSSILSAMDSLTQPSHTRPKASSTLQTAIGDLEVQGATQ